MPFEKSGGLETSTKTLPLRLSTPASSGALGETALGVAVKTVSPGAAASAKVPSITSSHKCAIVWKNL